MSTPRQHAAPPSAAPQLPEPTHAERVRTLFSLASTATLCTLSRKHPGFPFGSLMPFALDPSGCPIFLISNMAMHTQNLRADPRASLFLGPADAGSDSLGAARATLVGHAEPVGDPAQVRDLYLAAHPNSAYWVDFADFGFFRLTPIDLYYVGGFGTMGWVDAASYTDAQPDPLAAAAPGILTHMNADHADSMIALARRYSAIESTEATMLSIDRLGFTLRLKTPEGMKGTRINFPAQVRTSAETRAALIDMLRSDTGVA